MQFTKEQTSILFTFCNVNRQVVVGVHRHYYPKKSTIEQHASAAAEAWDHMICSLLKHIGNGLLQSKSMC